MMQNPANTKTHALLIKILESQRLLWARPRFPSSPVCEHSRICLQVIPHVKCDMHNPVRLHEFSKVEHSSLAFAVVVLLPDWLETCPVCHQIPTVTKLMETSVETSVRVLASTVRRFSKHVWFYSDVLELPDQ